jgi:hypothetical protein
MVGSVKAVVDRPGDVCLGEARLSCHGMARLVRIGLGEAALTR